MDDQPYRGPAAWMRANAFILVLAGLVAIALVGDRVAQSGVNPAENPQFAQATTAAPAADDAKSEAGETAAQPPEAQKQAEGAPADEGTANNGGSSQEGTKTGEPPAAAPGEEDTGSEPAKEAAPDPKPQ